MKLKVLEKNLVGIFDDVLDPVDCEDLYELAVWAQSHDVQLNRIEEDDLSMEAEPDYETHENEWKKRNFSIDMYTSPYVRIAQRLYDASKVALQQYFLEVHPSREFEVDYDRYDFSVLHLLPKGDKIDKHLDCYEYGLVFYIGTSEDYSEGELHFNNEGIVMPPVNNRLLIIPSDVPHEVYPIGSGIRVSMTTFVPVKEL